MDEHSKLRNSQAIPSSNDQGTSDQVTAVESGAAHGTFHVASEPYDFEAEYARVDAAIELAFAPSESGLASSQVDHTHNNQRPGDQQITNYLPLDHPAQLQAEIPAILVNGVVVEHSQEVSPFYRLSPEKRLIQQKQRSEWVERATTPQNLQQNLLHCPNDPPPADNYTIADLPLLCAQYARAQILYRNRVRWSRTLFKNWYEELRYIILHMERLQIWHPLDKWFRKIIFDQFKRLASDGEKSVKEEFLRKLELIEQYTKEDAWNKIDWVLEGDVEEVLEKVRDVVERVKHVRLQDYVRVRLMLIHEAGLVRECMESLGR